MLKAKPQKRKESLSRRIFVVCNYVLCLMAGLICLLPLLHILAVSAVIEAGCIQRKRRVCAGGFHV